MELNLKYYNDKDKYSDGDIEDKIIEFIKKYPDNYEEAFNEDSSWPVVYHLSDTRKNVIRWYPFKKDSSILEVGAGMGAITEELCHLCKSVTSIELSKRRATAILERNKDADNLEIIVGNFKNIKLTKKYDYILLNGVLEYAALYMDTDNPHEDFIKKLQKNLKSDGKILVAIENKMGLKYWCGAREDHTGKMFDGLNNYPDNNNIKTFSKYELECLAKSVGMYVNFYYMFPDYKFPKVVMTDKSLEKNVFAGYIPYYSHEMNLVLNESLLYKEIFSNNSVPFFANSYFLELSNNKDDVEVEFTIFNNEYRKSDQNLFTYLKDNRFYKRALTSESINHLLKIVEISSLIKKNDIRIIDVKKEGNEIYTDRMDGTYLTDNIKKLYSEGEYDKIEKIFETIYKIVKKSVGKRVVIEKNIFDEFGITKYPKNMVFYQYGFVDIVPNNIIIKDDEFCLFDQEWYFDNVPIEYIMYRGIIQAFSEIGHFDSPLKKKLFKKYNIDEKLFDDLEQRFMTSVRKDTCNYYYKLCFNGIMQNDIDTLVKESRENVDLRWQIDAMNKTIQALQQEKENLNKEYLSIVNSKRWKIINKIGNILHR